MKNIFIILAITFSWLTSLFAAGPQIPADTAKPATKSTIEALAGLKKDPYRDCLAEMNLGPRSFRWLREDELVAAQNEGLMFHMNENGYGILAYYVRTDEGSSLVTQSFVSCRLVDPNASPWTTPQHIHNIPFIPIPGGKDGAVMTPGSQIVAAFIDQSGNKTIVFLADDPATLRVSELGSYFFERSNLYALHYEISRGRWAAPIPLVTGIVNAGGFDYAKMVTNGKDLGVYWINLGELHYIGKSAGLPWGADTVVDGIGTPPWEPKMSMNEGGEIMAVWGQGRRSAREPHDLWYNTYSHERGWNTPSVVVPDYSASPSVVLDKTGKALLTYNQETDIDTPRWASYLKAKRYTPTSGWGDPISLDNSGRAEISQIVGNLDDSVSVLWRQSLFAFYEGGEELAGHPTYISHFNWDSGFTTPSIFFRRVGQAINHYNSAYMSLTHDIFSLTNASSTRPFVDPGSPREPPISLTCQSPSCTRPQERALSSTREIYSPQWASNKHGFTVMLWRANSLPTKEGEIAEGIYYNVYR